MDTRKFVDVFMKGFSFTLGALAATGLVALAILLVGLLTGQ